MPAVLAAFGKHEFSFGSGRIPGRGFISIILGTLSAFILTSILLQSRHLNVLYAFNATCLIFVSASEFNFAGQENTSRGFSLVSRIHLASYEYTGIKPSGKSE